ncbi:MAG: LysR family transcriptional regulator [Planctomycetota bacterium]
MDLAALRSFLVLAQLGNVTRAAEQLGLTQPAVSNQLARLEGEVAQRLFDRTPQGLQLTAAGELLRGFVEEGLERLNAGRAAVAELAGLTTGTLGVGGGATATTYLLPQHLGTYHSRHPEIQLFVREEGSEAVTEAVARGELDLGIVTLPVHAPARPPLVVEPWANDELVLIVPRRSALAKQQTFTWRDLDGQPLVLFQAGSSVRNLIDRRLKSAGIEVQIVMELRSIESIKQMVRQGIGAAFVSRFALDRRTRGLRCQDRPLHRQLGLIYRADRSLSPAAEAFLQLLRQDAPALPA